MHKRLGPFKKESDLWAEVAVEREQYPKSCDKGLMAHFAERAMEAGGPLMGAIIGRASERLKQEWIEDEQTPWSKGRDRTEVAVILASKARGEGS